MTTPATNQAPQPTDPRIIKALEANWQAEMEGAATYRTFADRENDAERKAKLSEMADSEIDHARRWAARLAELGAPAPVYKGSPTGKANSFANMVGGDYAALRRVELEERADIAKYSHQMRALGDEKSAAIIRDLIEDERRHSRTLRSLAQPQHERTAIDRLRGQDPERALEELRAKSGRKSPASWIGDAIYGVNDGLGAIFGIVSGVSGATTGNARYVLIAGIAGALASALSMGSGAYLAAKSEREIYQAEVQRKRDDLEANPEDALDEMTLVYRVKGFSEADARRTAENLSRNPDAFLKELAAQDLNISEDALSNPIVSAVSGALSTLVGAIIPVIPFFFMQGAPAIITAAVVSLLAHFAVGAAKTMITVRSWWSSGLEMTMVGAVEGVVTYLIGLSLAHIGGGMAAS